MKIWIPGKFSFTVSFLSFFFFLLFLVSTFLALFFVSFMMLFNFCLFGFVLLWYSLVQFNFQDQKDHINVVEVEFVKWQTSSAIMRCLSNSILYSILNSSGLQLSLDSICSDFSLLYFYSLKNKKRKQLQ